MVVKSTTSPSLRAGSTSAARSAGAQKIQPEKSQEQRLFTRRVPNRLPGNCIPMRLSDHR